MSYNFGPPGPIEHRGFGSLSAVTFRGIDVRIPSLALSAATFVGTLFAARAKHSGIGLLAVAPFALGNATLMGLFAFVSAVAEGDVREDVTPADREKAVLWCGALSLAAIAAPIAGTLIGRAMQKR